MNTEPWFGEFIDILKQIPAIKTDIDYVKRSIDRVTLSISDTYERHNSRYDSLKQEVADLEKRVRILEDDSISKSGYESIQKNKIKEVATKVAIVSTIVSLLGTAAALIYKIVIKSL